MKEGSRVGPFTIGPILGEGGMATVYLAEHNSDNTRVALKVLRTEIASDSSFIDAFGHEVRAAARLDHERITAVFDHGVITAQEALHTPEFEGAPWLAMELVEGGTISALAGKTPWAYLQTITLDVLDALAHAHARGMIHRDIKPGNVLLDAKTGRVKLTDFGLVHSIETEEDQKALLEQTISGTPSYMAPEQIQCDWRNYGPWTDLYSVGAMVWSLATGKPPYKGDVQRVFQMHLTGHLPEFDPSFPMPLALLDWLEAMMQTNSRHRFRRAADAAWALSQITGGMPSEPTKPYPTGNIDELSTLASPDQLNLETLILNPDETVTLRDDEDSTLDLSKAEHTWEDDTQVENTAPEIVNQRPPFPLDWGRSRRTRVHLHGAGLALFGLRATGVIGRYAERDRMWSAMRSVIEHNQSRLLLVDGASGSGKSTLVNWFCTRVDEVGGGQWMVAHHSEGGGSTDGISAMLARCFRTAGKSRAEAVEDIESHLKHYEHPSAEDAVGLAHLADPMADVADGVGLEVHFSSPEEKLVLLERYLRTLAARRPLIIWLDELHHSSESQALAHSILNSEESSPILLIGTVPTESLVQGSDLAERLETVVSHEQADSITLQPLDREGQTALIRELLGLDPSLATRVEAKSGGNPQFAVQLVSDWVERGMLVPGPNGFVLEGNQDVTIPADMLTVWKQRLEAAFKLHHPDEQFAVEIGAVLGNQVDRGEWKDALAKAGIPTPHGIMSELLRLRLIIREHQHGDWSFIHGLFRAAILDRVQAGRRTERWSSLCADVVPDKPLDIARKARLLVASNRTEEALRPLREAVNKELLTGDMGRAIELGTLRARIIEGVDIDPGGIHALDSEITDLYLTQGEERNQRMFSDGARLIEWATRLEEWDSVAQLRLSFGTAHLLLGESEQAAASVNEALALAREHRLKRVVEVLNRLCFVSIRMGDLQSAAAHAREATLAAESWGDTLGVARGYTMMSRVQWQCGELDTADFYLKEAALRFERIGSMRGQAEVWNTRGELARSRGDLQTAEVAYREADARYESCGSGDALFARLNLGSTYVNGGKYSEARAILDKVEESLQNTGRINIMLVTQLVRVNCFIHDNDWDRVEADLERIAPHLVKISLYDSDIASSARISALACEEKDQPALARCAWEIVHSQLTALGRTEEAREARERLDLSPEA